MIEGDLGECNASIVGSGGFSRNAMVEMWFLCVKLDGLRVSCARASRRKLDASFQCHVIVRVRVVSAMAYSQSRFRLFSCAV